MVNIISFPKGDKCVNTNVDMAIDQYHTDPKNHVWDLNSCGTGF